MKHLIFLSLIFLFANCEKEQMPTVTPRYSIVLFDDDYIPPSCNDDTVTCLPISDLNDIRFQLISDQWENVGGSGVFSQLVAFPCEQCGDKSIQEVYNMIYGTNQVSLFTVNNDAGVVRFVLNAGGFSNAQAGDYIYIAGDTTGRYNGYHLVTEVNAPDVLITSTPYTGLFGGTPDVGGMITESFILATYKEQLADDTEFSGDNYLWDFDTVLHPELNYTQGECLRLCVWQIRADFDVSTPPDIVAGSTCLGTTNCFIKVDNLCYTTKIKYQFNENAMGFYGEPSTNTVRLSMYLSRAQFESEEKSYQFSDGTFKKLSQRVNKQWTLKTDYLPIALHERIKMALSGDYVEVTNENENLAIEGIFNSEDYNIEWSENVDHPTALASTKVMKRILEASVNSNCNT